jgi:hypothetical protein
MSAFDIMAGHMNCKTDQIRAAWHAGDRIGAYVSRRGSLIDQLTR